MIQILRQKFGASCMGLKVNYQGQSGNYLTGQYRFCEAVNIAFGKTFLLNPESLICQGSKRSLGLDNDDNALRDEIHRESGIKKETIALALQNIPHWESPVQNILMGINEAQEEEVKPDMFILFITPGETMMLVKNYAEKLNQFPIIHPHFFLSVCGSILSGTWHTGKINISLGCPESRQYAGLSDNLLAVGIPYHDSKILFK